MQLAVADELLVMSLDLLAGRSRVSETALGLGVAAGLVTELVFAGALVVEDGHLGLGEFGPPADPLAEELYEQTRDELLAQDVAVRHWLLRRRDITPRVFDRLVLSGEFVRESGRRFGRLVVRHRPTNASGALLRAQRVPSFLRNRVELTAPDVVAAALAMIMDPSGRVMDLDDGGREYLADLIPALDPPLPELLRLTESTVNAALRNPRP